ncbi:MAG: serine protease [Clostridia bacterium]|nr:serine protease [Clostridia bacterium]
MKKIFGLLMLFVSLFLSTGCEFSVSKEDDAVPLESRLITVSQTTDTIEIASAVEPAIVGISGISSVGESVGSGVCVSENGYILTNSHVISDCDYIEVYLANKTTARASVVYNNPVLDLAIIQSSKSLPYLNIGSSDDLSVGQDVLAVGTPLSLTLTHSFTKGIVSALNRTLKVDSVSGEGYMQNLIQHDASLNPGNSGGPLLNSKGEVVGINTLKISGGEGIGFAIPSKSFESLLQSFVENINYQIPYLGVYGFDSEIANYYDKNISEEGFYVLDVSSQSPLKECGVAEASIIIKFNDRKIKNTLDLKDELYKLTSSDTVYIEYIKDGILYKAKTKLN